MLKSAEPSSAHPGSSTASAGITSTCLEEQKAAGHGRKHGENHSAGAAPSWQVQHKKRHLPVRQALRIPAPCSVPSGTLPPSQQCQQRGRQGARKRTIALRSVRDGTTLEPTLLGGREPATSSVLTVSSTRTTHIR